MSLYRAASVRKLDSLIISESGITGEILMERAGQAAFSVLCDRWPQISFITVVTGGGNNGGDGYVIARLARESGLAVALLSLVDPESLSGDAAIAKDKLLQAGVTPQLYNPELLPADGLIVDALLGTGLDREVSGNFFQAIAAINNCRLPVFSMDIPSGLHADTGVVLGISISAEATITFVGMKQGLLTGQGPDYTGQLYFDDLGGPEPVYASIPPDSVRTSYANTCRLLPTRKRSAHKGDHGHVLVIGGDRGYTGAPRMAAEAAYRSGAGLVSVATHPGHAALVNIQCPEIMSHPVETIPDLDPLLKKASVIAIGPGLGQSSWSRSLFARTLESGLPLVVDADALNLLAAEPERHPNWILTPHPGEASRLLSSTTMEVQVDRFTAIRSLQEKYAGVIVLKGCGTLIADRDEKISVCSGGNPGMASGGMGDVLTGVIAGLLAQGLSLDAAAVVGVCIHAEAADRVAMAGERGMLATDLLPWLRQLVNPM